MTFRLTLSVLGHTVLDLNAGEQAVEPPQPAPVDPNPEPNDTVTDRRAAPAMGFAAQQPCLPYRRPTAR